MGRAVNSGQIPNADSQRAPRSFPACAPGRAGAQTLIRIESDPGGVGMRRILFPPIVAIGIAALTVSCASFQSLQSDEYIRAGIQVARDPGSLSGAKLVKGWLSEYSSAYSARDVGVIVANDLAKQGWRDVWVLVELSSRDAFENEKENPGLPSTADRILSPTSADSAAALSIWRVSIYRSTSSGAESDTGGG